MKKEKVFSKEEIQNQIKILQDEQILWFKAEEVDLLKNSTSMVCIFIVFVSLSVIFPLVGIFGFQNSDLFYYIGLIALMFIGFGFPSMYGIREEHVMRKRLGLTPDQLNHYLKAWVLTNQRWVQKDYKCSFKERPERQFPGILGKELDIVSLPISHISAVVIELTTDDWGNAAIDTAHFHVDAETIINGKRRSSILNVQTYDLEKFLEILIAKIPLDKEPILLNDPAFLSWYLKKNPEQ